MSDRLSVARRVLVAAALFAAGCGSIPDVTPFADATAELHRAVDASGTAMTTEIRAVAGHLPEATRTALLDASANVEKDWDERRKATAALVEYADALADIAAAGLSGGESAQATADSVNALLKNVGASGAIPQTAVDVVKTAYKAAAEALAVDSMAKAVKAADSAVHGIASELDKDLADADAVVQTARIPIKSAIKKDVADDLEFHDKLVKRRTKLHQDFSAAAAGSSEQKAFIPAIDETDRLLAASASWYDPLRADLAAVDARIDADIAVIAKTRQMLAAWAEAHTSIGVALEQGRRVNVAKLVALATDVNDMIEKGRKP